MQTTTTISKALSNCFVTTILFSALLCPATGFTQSKITGNIIANKKPLQNASVMLLQARDSMLIKGSVSDVNGSYQFDNIVSGTYIIQASYSGYDEAFSSAFGIFAQTSFLVQTLTLSQKEMVLKDAVVIAKRPLFEQKMDRLVINVASAITNSGISALDVLMRSPGIMIDRQNNSMSMNGKNGVVVMINGKISRMPIAAVMQMLAGMNSANIEKIELITTPPANFDAEGNAGYINIVLKENNQYGTNGTFTATAGYGKRPFGSASINFNHQNGIFNLFGDYSSSTDKSITTSSFYKTNDQPNKLIQSETVTEQNPTTINNNGRLGLDVEISKKTTVGVIGTFLWNESSTESNNRNEVRVNGNLDTVINIENKEQHPLKSYTGNFNLTHKFSNNNDLTVNVDYANYRDQNTTHYDNVYEKGDGAFLRNEPVISQKTTPIYFWVSSLDDVWKISKKVTLESGLKGTVSRFTNAVSVQRDIQNNWKTDSSLTSKAFLRESIGAIYSSMSVQFSEKTSLKAGLRYEYTNSNLSSETQPNLVDRHYGRLFPTLYFSQTLAEKQSLNLAYSRRINRPTFNNMAPFVYFVDPGTLFSGNSALQPSISNSAQINYLLNQVSFSFSYTYDKNTITEFTPKIDPLTNRFMLFSENQPNSQVYSFNFSFPLKINSWWSMQNNVSGNRNVLNAIYYGTPFRLTQQSAFFESTQNFVLPKDFNLELRGYYSTGGMLSVYKLKPMASMDFGLQKKFTKSRSNLRLGVTDVFGVPKLKVSVNEPDKNLVAGGNLQFGNTRASLTFSKTFGSDKIKAKRERSSADDEKRRVN